MAAKTQPSKPKPKPTLKELLDEVAALAEPIVVTHKSNRLERRREERMARRAKP